MGWVCDSSLAFKRVKILKYMTLPTYHPRLHKLLLFFFGKSKYYFNITIGHVCFYIHYLMSNSRTTNYFTIFLSHLWRGRLWMVNHYRPSIFYLSITLGHIKVVARNYENFCGLKLFPFNNNDYFDIITKYEWLIWH